MIRDGEFLQSRVLGNYGRSCRKPRFRERAKRFGLTEGDRIVKMKVDNIFHLLLPIYLVVGYWQAYRIARHSVDTDLSIRQSSKVGLWSGRFMMVLMPASALFAVFDTWEGPVFPLFLGATVNIFWFFGGCRLVMIANKVSRSAS